MNRPISEFALFFNILWNGPNASLFKNRSNNVNKVIINEIKPHLNARWKIGGYFCNCIHMKIMNCFWKQNIRLLIAYWLKHAYHTFACFQPYHLSFTHLKWCNQALGSAINTTSFNFFLSFFLSSETAKQVPQCKNNVSVSVMFGLFLMLFHCYVPILFKIYFP